MSVGSAAVIKVTVSQTRVVNPVVHSVVFANTTGSEPEKGCGRPAIAIHNAGECSVSVATSAAIIAEISLHALTRHQYQRSKYTPPVPAPSSSTIFQPSLTDCRFQATKAAAKTRNTVASRETFT